MSLGQILPTVKPQQASGRAGQHLQQVAARVGDSPLPGSSSSNGKQHWPPRLYSCAQSLPRHRREKTLLSSGLEIRRAFPRTIGSTGSKASLKLHHPCCDQFARGRSSTLPDSLCQNRAARQARFERGRAYSRTAIQPRRAQEHVGDSLRAIGLWGLTTSWRKRRNWAMTNPFLKLVAIGNYGRSDLEDRFA